MPCVTSLSIPPNMVLETPGHTALAPLDTAVRPSHAAVLAGVSPKTVYAWLKRDLLVDYGGPGRVAAIRLGDLAALLGRRPFDWADVAHAGIVAQRRHGDAADRRRAR